MQIVSQGPTKSSGVFPFELRVFTAARFLSKSFEVQSQAHKYTENTLVFVCFASSPTSGHLLRSVDADLSRNFIRQWAAGWVSRWGLVVAWLQWEMTT